MSAEDDLVQELVRVRRGWGLQDRDLGKRIGPVLARICGIQATDNDRQIHDRVRLWLTARSAELPPELARAALVAFALDRDRQHRQLSQRMAHLAAEQLCAPRTVRRRVDHATRLIAHAALRDTTTVQDDAQPGWRLRSLRTVLRLDTVRPELHETREVVAIGEHGLAALPAVHESRVAHSTSAHAHFTLLPLVPCDHITLEVRFGPERRPTGLWRLDGVPPWSFDDVEPARWPVEQPLLPDHTGQVRLVFENLQQRHGYGLMWMPPSA
ncbi:hypothetical protein AB0K00_57490 [Dactylosporangium sp. NPDC049525]|uniref:hypothetical protein n=1 Tax=Dactylosporangium sp. NPDC049525 TaxID=3154730 RepID=UPI00344158E2